MSRSSRARHVTLTARATRATRALALALCLGLLSACGASSSSDETRTLDVWLMQGSLSESFIDAFVKEYESKNAGVEVEITLKKWPGIDKKVTKALKSGEGPDVFEVGTTQVAQYVATDQVKNLTRKVLDLGGADWIPGLAKAGQIDGYQFGIPFYAANRVVVYRKDLFKAAGITDEPDTRSEWIQVSAKLDAPPGQQGIYLPGQNWYVLAGFIWDEGGRLAVERSGHWNGALHTPEALRGMAFYEKLQSYGKGPVDSDEANPDQEKVFADGRIAQLITVPGAAQLITDANPGLKGKLGFFPIPGETAEKPGAVFTGGSVLIMPERDSDDEAAYRFIKLLTGAKWQKKMAKTMSYLPNKAALAGALKGVPGAQAMAAASEMGHAFPASPRWGDLEANNPIKRYQTKVLRGADPRSAAREASEKITALLGGTAEQSGRG